VLRDPIRADSSPIEHDRRASGAVVRRAILGVAGRVEYDHAHGGATICRDDGAHAVDAAGKMVDGAPNVAPLLFLNRIAPGLRSSRRPLRRSGSRRKAVVPQHSRPPARNRRGSRSDAIPIGSCGVWILDLHEIAAGLKAQPRLKRREESLQFGETNRGVRKLKAALISNFQACTNERAKRGTSER
jgi:hypothetical protein